MRLIPVLLMAGLLPGCATILKGTSQDMAVATNPPGAACTVDRQGERLGTVAPTPGNLRLDKSKNDLSVTCAKDGYQTVTVGAPATFNGATFFNLIAGGAPGFIIDAASGANFRYPAEVKLDMAPTAPPIASFAPETAPYAVSVVPNPLRPVRYAPGGS